MGKPKLFILLGGLDAAELSAFGRYLNRNHGRNDIALRTFSFLKKYHPDFADKKVEDLDHLARKVFCPKGPVDQKCRKNLSNTFHDLYNWLKDFLLLEKAKDGSMGSDYLWVSLLRGRRSLLVPYQQAASRLLARVREAPEKDALGHMRRLAACYLQYYEGMGMQKISEKREALIGCSRELEEFYKTWRRKIDCELINWNSQFLRDADNRILEEELQAPEPTLLNRLYGQVYSLLSAEGGDPEFQSLKKNAVRTGRPSGPDGGLYRLCLPEKLLQQTSAPWSKRLLAGSPRTGSVGHQTPVVCRKAGVDVRYAVL